MTKDKLMQRYGIVDGSTPKKEEKATSDSKAKEAFSSAPTARQVLNEGEQSGSNSVALSKGAKIGVTVSSAVVASIIMLTLLGVTQEIAKRFVFKTSGLLSTFLERVAKMGSFAHWKNKACSAPVFNEGRVFIGYANCIGLLYEPLCFNSHMVEADGRVFTVTDFDAKDCFEIEVAEVTGRLVLDHIVHAKEKTSFCFLNCEDGYSYELSLPTLTDMMAIKMGVGY